jgi:hypothetical protein
MMPARRRGGASAPAVRCYTRALKNARFLREAAPEIFAQDPGAEGFGTGGLVHDRFGDFERFLLLTEQGREESFRSREHAIERLVTRAWAERQVITVFALSQHPHVPVTIVVRRAPEPFQH